MNLRTALERLRRFVDRVPMPNPPGYDPFGCEPGERCDLRIPNGVVVSDADWTPEDGAGWIPEKDVRFP